MTEVSGVRATPGGRVRLVFQPGGFNILRDSRFSWLRSLDEDWIGGLALLGAIGLGIGAAAAAHAGLRPLAIALGVLVIPFVVVLLVFLVLKAIESLVGWIVLIGLIILFPLLLFPGVRQWAGKHWDGKPAARRLDWPRERIASTRRALDASGLAVQVLGADGATLVLRAGGEAARQLDTEFARLLGGPASPPARTFARR
ncbi:hypothetical protein F0L68_11025 [Solihabitans fulvus]|uniref:Uncharacterized protein n=1 Tax=Solihabitans fulvus TaxID=1892852 RepID=A0A5B2XIY3_9PSEU|nr:hypothetical protein [Solihabitans fulvus]KAA2262985.1 hypothetical protein F0L68_11025 [Solihabitans fulvus]